MLTLSLDMQGCLMARQLKGVEQKQFEKPVRACGTQIQYKWRKWDYT